MSWVVRVATVVLVTGTLAACGGSSNDSAGDAPTTTTTAAPTTTSMLPMDPAPTSCATLTGFARHAGEQHLQATLSEWSVVFSDSTPKPGLVKINVRNTGAEPHELAVIKGTAADLPLTPEGAVDEDALPAGANLGGVAVPAGEECELPVTLAAGPYVLVCNMVEGMRGQEPHIHYAEGMYKEIAVG